jgi:hypothetical protein
MRKLIVAIALVCSLTERARAEEWTTYDTTLELTLTAIAVVDYGQTRWFLANTPLVEMNPLLGERPNRESMLLFGGAALLGHAAIARLLPNPYRRAWQHAAICLWAANISRNATAIGVLRWSF